MENKQVTLAHDTGESKLMESLYKLKDSPIADEENSMLIGGLCGAIKTIVHKVCGDVEQFEDRKKDTIGQWSNWIDQMKQSVCQIETIATVIEEKVGHYYEVGDIFFHYEQEYLKS